jgi:hypothetical protein
MIDEFRIAKKESSTGEIIVSQCDAIMRTPYRMIRLDEQKSRANGNGPGAVGTRRLPTTKACCRRTALAAELRCEPGPLPNFAGS